MSDRVKGGMQRFTIQEAQNVTLGQPGSIHVVGTGAVEASSGAFVAITFLEDTVFTALVAEAVSPQLYPSSAGASTDISANGGATGSEIFPKGITMYGRWSGFTLASGRVIAYVG
tara:strand:+ start:2521 stop:2865 length:345 start_codon:yes stop_codon:yes gene_type:complete